MHKQLIYEFTGKEILNSNDMPNQFFIKGKIAANLRKTSGEKGVTLHPAQELAQKRLEIIRQEAELSLRKSRSKKRLRKAGASEEEIEEKLQKIIEDFTIDTPSSQIEIPYIFDTYKICATVCPPTRRRTDPPNFYPTIKALIDGLTDASWWEDDNFKKLLEVSFKYGGLSGKKDIFKFVLDIETADPKDYITISEFIEE